MLLCTKPPAPENCLRHLRKQRAYANMVPTKYRGNGYMDSTIVYIKTPQGQEEIATRARQLPARARSLLIMIDGRRTAGELVASNPAPAEAEGHLAMLLENGFIALVPQAAKPAPAPAPAPQRVIDLAPIKDFIAITLTDTIGPDADMFTVKIEAITSLPELQKQGEKMRDVIRAAGGNKKAEAFWEKLSAMWA